MVMLFDMFSGTSNAVVGLQGRLMFQRGLTAVGNIDLKGTI